MSSPDRDGASCDEMQIALQALLDREQSTSDETNVWAHVAACDRCARALAHDRALGRALDRLKAAGRAPASLRERLRRLLSGGGGGHGARNGGGSGGGSRST
jgi:anti-sigma factor (TIGR02949 family)